MQETGLVSGRERAWHCQSASSPCFWPAGVSGGQTFPHPGRSSILLLFLALLFLTLFSVQFSCSVVSDSLRPHELHPNS